MKIKELIATVVLALAAQAGMAQGFEGGIPAGWQCSGRCGTSGADGVVGLAPTGASAYGYVVTDGTGPAGLSPFGLGEETDGARLRSTSFAANAGDALKFHFNYVTSDGAEFADYGWARLLNASDKSEVALLFTARTKESGSIVPGQDLPAPGATLTPASVDIIGGAPVWSPLGASSGGCYGVGCGHTGWVESSFTIAGAGNYLLEFGVVNWSDNAFQSGIAFDGLTVAGVPVVPEPSTSALLLAGLAGIAWLGRRRAA